MRGSRGNMGKSTKTDAIYTGPCIRCGAVQQKTICNACWQLSPWDKAYSMPEAEK